MNSIPMFFLLLAFVTFVGGWLYVAMVSLGLAVFALVRDVLAPMAPLRE